MLPVLIGLISTLMRPVETAQGNARPAAVVARAVS
jgi:hypothetical protein